MHAMIYILGSIKVSAEFKVFQHLIIQNNNIQMSMHLKNNLQYLLI